RHAEWAATARLLRRAHIRDGARGGIPARVSRAVPVPEQSGMKRGFDVLRDKALNRSITFGRRERDRLGLRGLLPHCVATRRQMVDRVMVNLDRLPRDIDRYMLLSARQERNDRLFSQPVIDHVAGTLPLIYTPTVGEACREFPHRARDPKGFFIPPADRGEIRRILAN